MGLISNFFNRLTSPKPGVGERSALVPASAGPIFTVVRLLSSTSNLSLISGTNSNLTLSGDVISAVVALSAGVSQTAVVREVSGDLAVEYPIVFNVAAPPPSSYRVTHLDDGGASAGLWYGASANPAWVYDNSTNRVLGVVQRYNYNGGSALKENTLLAYDLNSQSAEILGVIMTDDGTIVGSADQHGVGTLCKDQFGFWHSYGGGHNQPMKHSVSLDGGRTWQASGTVGTGMTYSHPVQIGDTQYLIMREAPGGNTYPLVYYKSRTIDPVTGAISWEGKVTLINLQTDTRVYAGSVIVVGTDIYICWTRAKGDDTTRMDLYIGVLDTLTGNFRNLSGSTVITAGNLPLLRATADADFRIVDQTTAGTSESNTPTIWIDNEGLHNLYQDGAGGLAYTYSRYSLSGTLLEGPTVIGSAPYRYATPAIGPRPGGGVEVLFPSLDGAPNDMDMQSPYSRGGSIWRTERPAGGTWSTPTLVMAATPVHPLDSVCRVEGAPANFRFAFAERAIEDKDFGTGGNLRTYGWGAGGMVTTPFIEDVDAKAYIGNATYSDADRAIVTGYFRGIKRCGWWQQGDLAYLMGEPVEAVARKNVFGGYALANTAAGVTHTPYKGFDGTASAKLTTGFNPSTATNRRITPTSMNLSIFPTEEVTSVSSDLGTLDTTTVSLALSSRSSAGRASTLLGDATATNLNVGTASLLVMAQRAGGNTKSIHARRKDTIVNANVAPTSLPNGDVCLLGNGSGFSQRRLGYAHVGAQIDVGPIMQVIKRYMFERCGMN